jgi:hypothetical protein
MTASFDIFRSQIIHAVTGKEHVAVENPGALDRFCQRLVEAEEVHTILKNCGYGCSWSSFVERARLIPDSTTMLIRAKKRREDSRDV